MRREGIADKMSVSGQGNTWLWLGISFWGYCAHTWKRERLAHMIHPVVIGLAIALFIVCITTLIMESKEKIDKGDKWEINSKRSANGL